MPSRIDWYLVELERMIKGRIALGALHELQTETRSHLEATRDALVAQGCSPDSSEIEAIKEFGKPETVALSYLELPNSVTRSGAAVVAIAAAVVACVQPLANTGGLNGIPSLTVWMTCMAVFVVLGAYSRVRLYLPVAGLAAIAAVVMTLNISPRMLDLDQGFMSRAAAKPALAVIRNDISEQEKLLAEFDKAEPFEDHSMVRLAYYSGLTTGYGYGSGYPTARQLEFQPYRNYAYTNGYRLTASDIKNYRSDLRSRKDAIERGLKRSVESTKDYAASIQAALARPPATWSRGTAAAAFGTAAFSCAIGFGLIIAMRVGAGLLRRGAIRRRALA